MGGRSRICYKNGDDPFRVISSHLISAKVYGKVCGVMDKKNMETKTENKQVKSTSDELESLRQPQYNEPIDELVKLLSQSKRVFVLGAGCSKCAGLPLMEELTAEVLKEIPKTDKAHIIL